MGHCNALTRFLDTHFDLRIKQEGAPQEIPERNLLAIRGYEYAL